jgi:membrane protein
MVTRRDVGLRLVAFIRTVVVVGRRTEEVGVGLLAASIAYYGLVSATQIVLLGYLVLATLHGGQLATAVVSSLGAVLSTAGAEFVEGTLTRAAGREQVTALSLVVLAWSTLRLLRAVDRAFSRVYEPDPDESVLRQVRDSALVFAVAVVVLLGTVGVGILAGLSPDWGPAGTVLGIAGLAAIAFTLYYVFPNVDLHPGEAIPGTVVAVAGLLALQVGVVLYARFASEFAVYGVLGSVVVFTTWLYLASAVLLVGAVVNAVVAGRKPPVPAGTSHR